MRYVIVSVHGPQRRIRKLSEVFATRNANDFYDKHAGAGVFKCMQTQSLDS